MNSVLGIHDTVQIMNSASMAKPQSEVKIKLKCRSVVQLWVVHGEEDRDLN